jgi:hypothetical protein
MVHVDHSKLGDWLTRNYQKVDRTYKMANQDAGKFRATPASARKVVLTTKFDPTDVWYTKQLYFGCVFILEIF